MQTRFWNLDAGLAARVRMAIRESSQSVLEAWAPIILGKCERDEAAIPRSISSCYGPSTRSYVTTIFCKAT